MTCPSGVPYGAKNSGEASMIARQDDQLMIVTCRTTTRGLARSASISRRARSRSWIVSARPPASSSRRCRPAGPPGRGGEDGVRVGAGRVRRPCPAAPGRASTGRRGGGPAGPEAAASRGGACRAREPQGVGDRLARGQLCAVMPRTQRSRACSSRMSVCGGSPSSFGSPHTASGDDDHHHAATVSAPPPDTPASTPRPTRQPGRQRPSPDVVHNRRPQACGRDGGRSRPPGDRPPGPAAEHDGPRDRQHGGTAPRPRRSSPAASSCQERRELVQQRGVRVVTPGPRSRSRRW